MTDTSNDVRLERHACKACQSEIYYSVLYCVTCRRKDRDFQNEEDKVTKPGDWSHSSTPDNIGPGDWYTRLQGKRITLTQGAAPPPPTPPPPVVDPVREAQRAASAKPAAVIRGKRGLYHAFDSKAWGRRHELVDDPDGVEINLDAIQLPSDFPKVPSGLWARVIDFYFAYLDPKAHGVKNGIDSKSEASVIFARKRRDLKEWRVFVPRQVVGAATVDGDLTQLIDIETGEEFDKGLPEELAHAGSSHSHQTMSAFFSSRDDASELTVPGLHIVCGELDATKMTYIPKASIVQKGKRYHVDFHSVVDATPRSDVTYHPKVLDYVTKEKPTETVTYVGYAGLYSSEFDYEKWARDFHGGRRDSDRLAGFTRYNVTSDGVEKDGKRRESNIQRWLNDPNATLDKSKRQRSDKSQRRKVQPDLDKLPLELRLALQIAREASEKLPREKQCAIRAFCNAMVRCYGDDEAHLILHDLAYDFLYADDSDLSDDDDDETDRLPIIDNPVGD